MPDVLKIALLAFQNILGALTQALLYYYLYLSRLNFPKGTCSSPLSERTYAYQLHLPCVSAFNPKTSGHPLKISAEI